MEIIGLSVQGVWLFLPVLHAVELGFTQSSAHALGCSRRAACASYGGTISGQSAKVA
jgi:hypothetical protein